MLVLVDASPSSAVEMTASKHYVKGHEEDLTEAKGIARGGIRGSKKLSEQYTRHGDQSTSCCASCADDAGDS